MTKQEFIKMWRPSHMLIADLEAVIATEIAKVIEAKLKHADQVIDQVTDQVQKAKPFDKDRFERMFCASIGIGEFASFSDIILSVETTLHKLDAYYASKEGGN